LLTGGVTLKNFFKKYSYTMFKLFLNQFAIALFGIALFSACSRTESKALVVVTSIFSVLFYLFLQYAVMWEVGAKDGISAVARKQSRGLWRGFVIALIANSINILLAILVLSGTFAPAETFAKNMSGACSLISTFLQGMYAGIMLQPLNGLNLLHYAWMHFAIVVPSVLVCGLAYIFGSFNLHATNILIPKNKDVKNNGRPDKKSLLFSGKNDTEAEEVTDREDDGDVSGSDL
jgi:uncharacterized membrane protein